MEAQLNTPTWQAKFDKSFPVEIIGIVNDVSKSETPQNNAKNEGLNPWLVLGVLAIAGVAVYIILKLEKDENRKQESQNQPS